MMPVIPPPSGSSMTDAVAAAEHMCPRSIDTPAAAAVMQQLGNRQMQVPSLLVMPHISAAQAHNCSYIN